jgi:hypothetical protein
LIIDKSKLRDYAEVEWFSYPMSNERDTWEKACEIPEYDYNFSVKGFNGEKYQFGNLIFNMGNMGDKCYFEYQKIKGYIEMPVSVYDDNHNLYTPGIASLTLMKTPLAEISFWISQSSLRLEKGYDDEVLKSVRVGPEVKSIKIDRNGIICMGVNSYSALACKRFYVESSDDIRICNATDLIPNGYEGGNCPLLLTTADLTLRDGCKAININATRNSIDLIIPEQ